MQIQSTGQTIQPAQMQQTQLRKMDGSGNGQGSRDGSNCNTASTTLSSLQQSAALSASSTFSTYA
jgi:hypothetical protein